MNIGIGITDSVVIVSYMLLVLAIGLWIGRGRQSSADYFLGNRSMPSAALLLSIVATETSTVTFLSIPGITAAAGGNLTFLQITIGYIAGRLFVVFVLLPVYFQGKPFTAYEVLETRFGRLSRRMVSTLFLVTRNAGDSLRLFLTALALQIVLGLDLTMSVIAIGSVTILYTFVGGAKSVIWNDCIQFVIYMLGAAIAAVIITNAVPGGLGEIIAFAAAEDKFRFLDFNLSLVHPGMTFWAGLAGGAFLTAATHGTDQLMVQRYLSARNQRGAAMALGLSGFIVLLQFAVFLLIGIGLAALFQTTGETGGEQLMQSDQLFAYFIVNYMPVGLLGLTLAAVFAAAMSTLSSSLNASAAVFMNDLYKRPSQREPGAEMRANRTATVVFGIVQIGLALLFGMLESSESIVANVLKVAGFAIGPVLGLYFLAVFTTRVRQTHALTGFVTGVVVLSIVAFGSDVFWAWYALIGSLVTLAAGRLACALDTRPMQKNAASGGRD